MGGKIKTVRPELCSPISPDVIASPNTEELNYSKDKITCKILAFLRTEHEKKEMFA